MNSVRIIKCICHGTRFTELKRIAEKTARPAEDFEAIGYGADKPVANNQTERGRAENRRIDIVILRSAP